MPSLGSYVLVFIGLALTVFLTACTSNEADGTVPERIQVQLLVEQPTSGLPIGTLLNVRSLTESPVPISHVELYATQLPSDVQNVLLRSDAAPADQTAFTAMQRFTPARSGDYIIKVIAYDKTGAKAESNPISFRVE